MKRKLTAALLLLFATMLLAGCSGRIDINELAIVTAVGLDKGNQPNTVKVTAQIVRPASTRGQTGATSEGATESIYSISAEGKTIFEAIRNLARFSSRRVFWAHCYIIVINEDLAKSGITDIIDFFSRNHELRMRSWVVVTPDKASELVTTITGLEIVPGDALDRLFRFNRIVAEAPRTNMMRLQESFYSKSSQSVLAKMKLNKREISNKKPDKSETINQIELSGAAVFKQEKMLGWLSPGETRGLMFFVEKVESAIVTLPCPDQPDRQLSIEMKKQKFTVTPTYRNGNVKFAVKLTTTDELAESGCTMDLSEMREELEKELADKLQSELESVIKKAQKIYKIDFLKLGETFNNRYPAEWKDLQKDWEAEFVKAKVSVKVDAHINSSVLLQRATKTRKDGD